MCPSWEWFRFAMLRIRSNQFTFCIYWTIEIELYISLTISHLLFLYVFSYFALYFFTSKRYILYQYFQYSYRSFWPSISVFFFFLILINESSPQQFAFIFYSILYQSHPIFCLYFGYFAQNYEHSNSMNTECNK